MNTPNDPNTVLNHLLDSVDQSPSLDRIQRVRRSIILAASAQPKGSFFSFFRFEPAFLLATGLLGAVLGITVSLNSLSDEGVATIFDSQPHSFVVGDLG